MLSTQGVVPTCRSLDCVSILSLTCDDAHTVWSAARGFDADDCYSRTPSPGDGAAPWLATEFYFGVPPAGQLTFFGDDAAAALFAEAVERMEALGGHKVEIDFAIFRAAGDLVHAGPPSDAFAAEYELRDLRRAAETQWERMDVLLLPVASDIDPGYCTSFINLLDLAAVVVPAGVRPNGLPFGVSLIGPAFSEQALLSLGDRFHRAQTLVPGDALDFASCPPGCIAVAVVGGHLCGEPLNYELTNRQARRIKACRTAPGYRLYALDGAMPPKPGLVRDPHFRGPGIEVEVWAVPEHHFGSFVAGVPAPLGIGNAVLDDGSTVKSFICEPYAVSAATEITRFGGWRHYLSQALSMK
jgi:allophanate hydrolase